MHFSRIVNALRVEADFDDREISTEYIPLLARLSAMQKRKGKRVVVLMAAPPGSGKTTLALFLQYLSEHTQGVTPLIALGMDGFHRYERDLTGRTVLRDGEPVPMLKIKGAPVTFDLDKLTEKLRTVAAGACCKWPEYSRRLHDPVEDVVTVDRDIVLIEGNYLLLDESGWRELHSYADYTIRLAADEAKLRQRLIDRKEASGVSRAEAEAHVAFSDMKNVRLCLAHTLPADLELHV